MKTLLLLSLLSFSSFAGSHEIIGGSCWKCVGGSFTTGEIECQPERTARLFEVPMQECLDNRQAATAPLRSQVKRNYQDTSNIQKARNNARIRRLQQEISRLKRQNQNL